MAKPAWPTFLSLIIAASAVLIFTALIAPAESKSPSPSPALWVEPPSPRPETFTPTPQQWPFKPWSYAKAYTFNFMPYGPGIQLQVIKNGIWSSTVRSEQLITRAQVHQITELVNKTRGTFLTSKCPFPRHAVVLFDDEDEPIANVDICFQCEDIFSWPNFKVSNDFKYGVYDASDSDDETNDESNGLKGGLWKEFTAALKGYKTLFKELNQPIDWRTVRHGRTPRRIQPPKIRQRPPTNAPAPRPR